MSCWDLAAPKVIPDGVWRFILRGWVTVGLLRRYARGPTIYQRQNRQLVHRLRRSPIAVCTDIVNRQHYDLPVEFFALVLGKRMKYSACLWPQGVRTLDDAEEAMLRLTCFRSRLEDGMDVLDLGCGWGSLSLWICENYPNCHVVAVSNSQRQGEYLRNLKRELGLPNLEVMTVDVNDLRVCRTFDLVLSIGMFEHVKNYELLLARIASWLNPGGRLFVQVFCHRHFAFEYDHTDREQWTAQRFFAGGTMLSSDLLFQFQRDLRVVEYWFLPGSHYENTLRAWTRNFDRNIDLIRPILARHYSVISTAASVARWRLFLMGCAESCGIRRGTEHLIGDYLFERPICHEPSHTIPDAAISHQKLVLA